MKKFLLIKSLLICIIWFLNLGNLCFSQNPDLPSERCQIVLKNNKLIKDARLWEIYPNRVEYEKDGSLHDLLIEEIERIETDNEIITFEQDGKLFKQPYDLIILHPASTLMQGKEGDTIKCRITRVTSADIYYYRQKKREKETYVSLSIVKKYVRNGVEKRVGDEKFSADKSGQSPKEPITASKEGYNDMIITKMAFPDGDSIKCNIAEVKSDVIYYSHQQHGKEKKTWIELASVKKYVWNGVLKIPGEEEYYLKEEKKQVFEGKTIPAYAFKNTRSPCEAGRADAEYFHQPGAGNFCAGAGCGLFGIGIVALNNPAYPNPKQISNPEFLKDSEYLRCYRKRAKQKNIGNAAIGWGIVTAFSLLLIFAAAGL